MTDLEIGEEFLGVFFVFRNDYEFKIADLFFAYCAIASLQYFYRERNLFPAHSRVPRKLIMHVSSFE